MEARARTATLARAVKSGAWPLAALALAALAYAPLWRASLSVPSRYGFETALFRPAPMPALLVIAIAGWLAWRRRARLRALTASGSSALAAGWFAVAATASAWAALTQAAEILFASAAAMLLAFAAAARGRAAVRVLLLPALVLLLGLALPPPIEAELVWQLQRWAAAGAADLLNALGSEAAYAGLVLSSGGHEFQVIDGCSGLRGILILSLVAVIVRELFAAAGAREWLVLAVAPLLGHALNLVRIAWVATSEHPEDLAGFAGDHTPQGLAVLGAGTATLYALGWVLARTRRAADVRPTAPAAAALPWPTLAIALAAIWAIAVGLPPFRPAPGAAALGFPDAQGGWTGEAMAPDPAFEGTLSPGQFVHRRYVKTGRDGRVRTVELFAAAEAPVRTSHLFTSKLAAPGPPWWAKEQRTLSLQPLGRDALLTQAAYGFGPEHAVIYLWHQRDLGLARESLRALLALESSPWRRARPRVVVRLVAPTPQGGPVAYDIAKRALDVFVSDFRDPLVAL